MICFAGLNNKRPEEYPALLTEFTNEEISAIRKKVKGKTIDDVLSNPGFKDKDISVTQGMFFVAHNQYIHGAYFRHSQAEEVAENTRKLGYLYTIYQLPIGILQQRNFKGTGITFDEEEIKEIYQKLQENLQIN